MMQDSALLLRVNVIAVDVKAISRLQPVSLPTRLSVAFVSVLTTMLQKERRQNSKPGAPRSDRATADDA